MSLTFVVRYKRNRLQSPYEKNQRVNVNESVYSILTIMACLLKRQATKCGISDRTRQNRLFWLARLHSTKYLQLWGRDEQYFARCASIPIQL